MNPTPKAKVSAFLWFLHHSDCRDDDILCIIFMHAALAQIRVPVWPAHLRQIHWMREPTDSTRSRASLALAAYHELLLSPPTYNDEHIYEKRPPIAQRTLDSVSLHGTASSAFNDRTEKPRTDRK